jgi:hypothetical protein
LTDEFVAYTTKGKQLSTTKTPGILALGQNPPGMWDGMRPGFLALIPGKMLLCCNALLR